MIKLVERGKYLFERLYPYAAALVLCYTAYQYNLVSKEYTDISDMLDASLTIAALIIGFIGAILPMIVSLKSESEYVRTVMKLDAKNLFAKYIRETVVSGLVLIGYTFILYFELPLKEMWIIEVYIWIYILIAFLFNTYRSISVILKLMFEKTHASPQEFYKKNSFKDQNEILLENENRLDSGGGG